MITLPTAARQPQLTVPSDGFEDERDLGEDTTTPQQRLAKVIAQLIPLRPKTCFHCEKFMETCVYKPGEQSCQRCALVDRACFEDRRLKWGPTEHKLMREIASKGELVDLALKQFLGAQLELEQWLDIQQWLDPVLFGKDMGIPSYDSGSDANARAGQSSTKPGGPTRVVTKCPRSRSPSDDAGPPNARRRKRTHNRAAPSPTDPGDKPVHVAAYMPSPGEEHDHINALCPLDAMMSLFEEVHHYRDYPLCLSSPPVYSGSGELYPETVEDVITGYSMAIGEIATVLENHGCIDLTHKLDLDLSSEFPVCNGGFGDVYSGQLKNGTRVAIKTERLHTIPNWGGKNIQRVTRELCTWSKCRHLNVLELMGFVEFRERIGMVSLWMENGSVRDYLSRRPDIDRCELCYGISDGLAYLHGIKIVHGDLKGANVLVSEDGTPRLADFGNSILQDPSVQYTSTNLEICISPRWTAPDILEGETGYSYAGDIFALGMTLIETITGALPYQDVKRDEVVIITIAVKKKLPERPDAHIPTFSEHGDTFWFLLTNCWAYDPEERPSAADVRDKMRGVTCEGLKGRPRVGL